MTVVNRKPKINVRSVQNIGCNGKKYSTGKQNSNVSDNNWIIEISRLDDFTTGVFQNRINTSIINNPRSTPIIHDDSIKALYNLPM